MMTRCKKYTYNWQGWEVSKHVLVLRWSRGAFLVSWSWGLMSWSWTLVSWSWQSVLVTSLTTVRCNKQTCRHNQHFTASNQRHNNTTLLGWVHHTTSKSVCNYLRLRSELVKVAVASRSMVTDWWSSLVALRLVSSTDSWLVVSMMCWVSGSDKVTVFTICRSVSSALDTAAVQTPNHTILEFCLSRDLRQEDC